MAIQIQISDEQWKKLNSMKKRGESFQEVIDKLLKTKKELHPSNEGDALYSK